MPALIGILLDFSMSMKETVYEKIDKKDGKRSRSIFKVIDDLIIKENILPENRIFAIGFGTRCGLKTVDVIGTIQQFHDRYTKTNKNKEYSAILDEVYTILEKGGAKSIRRWVSEGMIKKKVPYYLLALILDALKKSSSFCAKVVSCLPSICSAKTLFETAKEVIKSMVADDGDVDAIVGKIKQYFVEDEILIRYILKEEATVFDFNFAADAIRYWFEGKAIDDDKVQKVLELIDPFVYGESTLYTTLDKSINIFRKSEYSNFKKYLFVLSNGIPKDKGNITTAVEKFEKIGVKVIGCFVSNLVLLESKRLYDSEGSLDDFGAKLIFTLSSRIKTEILPYMIFEKLGWSIDKTTNETKLFLQVNHPDHIHEACTLAKRIVSSQDALLEFLGTISLSKYIQQINNSFSAQRQVGETCYANAVAAVLHLAMKRILNRTEGYPNFFELREDIISAFGQHGANVDKVLQTFCSKYRLKYDKVNAEGALEAITCNRPIISTFALTKKEWDAFSNFFGQNRSGVLTKKEVDISKRSSFDSDEDGGHAVVLTSFNSECLRFMNSWGDQWGDMGFFRVQNREVLACEYYDVYWVDDNLHEDEKKHYLLHGVKAAKKIVEKLRNIASAEFECPKCKRSSLVRKFTGTFTDAQCPKCLKKFECINEGNTLAMNLYLTSLLR